MEKLKLDYEDYPRQHDLLQWDRHHPLRQELVNARCESADDVAQWIVQHKTSSNISPNSSLYQIYAELSANSALTLIEVSYYLLDKQISQLAKEFKEKGGFTERLYNVKK